MKVLAQLLVAGGLWAMLGVPAWGAEKQAMVPVKESVESTLRYNHSLRSLQENKAAVGHEVTRARAGYGPRVDLTARGGVGKLSDNTTRAYDYNDVRPNSSASLLLSQPLWDGWSTRGKVREAEATYRSMEYRVLDNANSLALDTIIAHVDVLRRQEIYDSAVEYVARHEEILEKARDREQLGVDTMADVSQAQSRLARARSALTDAKASLRIGEENYTRLTRHSAFNLAPVVMPGAMYGSAEEVYKEAEQGNPKVSAYLEDVKAARAKKEQARAAHLPYFGIEAGPSYSDRDGKDKLWTSEFDVSAVVRWNLFNSGADVAENKAAAARIRQSRQALYDYMDELRLAVEESWAEYRSAQEQYAFYKEAVQHNRNTRKAYEEQFVLGERSLLDVLDAESELFNSSTQSATAFGNYLIAAYSMKALAGELLEELGIRPERVNAPFADHEPLDEVKVRN